MNYCRHIIFSLFQFTELYSPLHFRFIVRILSSPNLSVEQQSELVQDFYVVSTFVFRTMHMFVLLSVSPQYYALINRARGSYEEIFVLRFKAYGPNAVRSVRLECQNKYFPYGPKSRLIRALLYAYTNKIVYDKILLS